MLASRRALLRAPRLSVAAGRPITRPRCYATAAEAPSTDAKTVHKPAAKPLSRPAARPAPKPISTPAPRPASNSAASKTPPPPQPLNDVAFDSTIWAAPQPVESIKDIAWEKSYFGIGTSPVSQKQCDVLTRPLKVDEIEVKPDGIVYLPEVRYRKRLNEAFGPMGWGIVPRGEPVVGDQIVTREYALIVGGLFVAQAQGVNNYFGAEQVPSALEGAKSNALMRCCKDLGVASELWDPSFIRWFRSNYMEEAWVEHAVTKKKRVLWFRKGHVDPQYPYKITK